MSSGSLYPNKVSWERPATRGELRAPRQRRSTEGREGGGGGLYEEDADKGALRVEGEQRLAVPRRRGHRGGPSSRLRTHPRPTTAPRRTPCLTLSQIGT